MGRPGVRLSPARLLAVARKEVIQLRRDPRSLIMAFVLPVLLVLLFGYAISFDVDRIGLAVLDRDNGASSRALVDGFRRSGYFDLVDRPASPGAAERLLERGSARLVLVIPPDFGASLGAGRPAPLQALVDGSDANGAGIALAYAEAVVADFARRAAGRGGPAAKPPLRPEIRVWYNERLDSRRMIVPGLIAVLMMIIAAMLTSLTIAREWERGTMEQLAATPVARAEVVLGKLLPYLAIGLIDVFSTAAIGRVVFEVPYRGDVLLLGAISFVFLVGAFGLGMFISAVVKSQLLATQVSMLVSYLPGFLLSGFAFDVATMPLPLRALSAVVPARHYVTILRGLFLKGVGLEALWPEALALLVFAGLGLGLAVRAFRKETG
ncbi:MAG TPA: ABC transporter permease [Gemmatimonadales bacterium]|nr:ABC transporter permease [Gemmatimonadales bacterium]